MSSGPILVFACRWCSLLGAERAARERLPLPDGLRIIPIDCAGSVSPEKVLEALLNGAAGVAVMGCHMGGCRHNDANRDAHVRISVLKDLLDAVGLDGIDRQFLLAILQKFGGGPVGIDNLAAAVGEESETLEYVVEPYLIQQGFVVRTPRGRVATDLAARHFGIAPQQGRQKNLF